MAIQFKILKTLIMSCLISTIFSQVALADYSHWFDGNVRSVHVIEGATEGRCSKATCVLIQLENITSSTGTQCDTDGDRYAAFELNNEWGNSMMSMAIAANISGKKVRVHADGCQGVWSSYNSSNLGWLKIF